MKYITELFFQYGLLAMFLIILIEYACFPISSEIVLPFSGAFASIQGIPFLIVLPLSVIAGLIGTSLCYLIGYYGGHFIINKIRHKYPKSNKGLDSSHNFFDKYGKYAVCMGRVIPICRTYIAFFAGIAKLNFITYIISSAIGITVWNTLLIGLGYVFHSNYQVIAIYYNKFKDIIIPIFLFAFFYYIIKHFRSKRIKY